MVAGCSRVWGSGWLQVAIRFWRWVDDSCSLQYGLGGLGGCRLRHGEGLEEIHRRAEQVSSVRLSTYRRPWTGLGWLCRTGYVIFCLPACLPVCLSVCLSACLSDRLCLSFHAVAQELTSTDWTEYVIFFLYLTVSV